MDKENLDYIADRLYNKLKNRFDNIGLGDETGAKTLDSKSSRFFNFDFVVGKNNYGNVTLTLFPSGKIAIYYGDSLLSDLGVNKKAWYDFIKYIKEFANGFMLEFSPENLSKSSLDRKDIEQIVNTFNMEESFMNKKNPITEYEEASNEPQNISVDPAIVVFVNSNKPLILRSDPKVDNFIKKTKYADKNALIERVLSDIAERAVGDEIMDKVANFAGLASEAFAGQQLSIGNKNVTAQVKSLAVKLVKKYLDNMRDMIHNPEKTNQYRINPKQAYKFANGHGSKKEFDDEDEDLEEEGYKSWDRAGVTGLSEMNEFDSWMNNILNETVEFLKPKLEENTDKIISNLVSRMVNGGVEQDLAYQAARYSVHKFTFLFDKVKQLQIKRVPQEQIDAQKNKLNSLLWKECKQYVWNKGGEIEEDALAKKTPGKELDSNAKVDDGDTPEEEDKEVLNEDYENVVMAALEKANLRGYMRGNILFVPSAMIGQATAVVKALGVTMPMIKPDNQDTATSTPQAANKPGMGTIPNNSANMTTPGTNESLLYDIGKLAGLRIDNGI